MGETESGYRAAKSTTVLYLTRIHDRCSSRKIQCYQLSTLCKLIFVFPFKPCPSVLPGVWVLQDAFLEMKLLRISPSSNFALVVMKDWSIYRLLLERVVRGMLLGKSLTSPFFL